MRASWISGRAVARIIAVAMMALVLESCGANPFSTSSNQGDVELRNFTGTPVSMIKDGESASASTIILFNGKRIVSANNSLGSSTTFHVVSGGTTLATITCTVTERGWISVNPSVPWTAYGLDCVDW